MTEGDDDAQAYPVEATRPSSPLEDLKTPPALRLMEKIRLSV